MKNSVLQVKERSSELYFCSVWTIRIVAIDAWILVISNQRFVRDIQFIV